LIRSANHSSFPGSGAADDAEAQVCVAEQSRAFVDIVTDGLVRWSGPLSHVAAGLEGVEPGPARPWFSTGADDARPVVVGRVARRAPILLHEYTCAAAVGPKGLKMVLPGPVTFARTADDRHYGSVEALARHVAAALSEEVADLAAAGCRIFHLDEPILTRRPDDAALALEAAAAVFARAGEDAVTILSTSFGDLAWDRGLLGRIPATHLGLDLVEGPGNWEVLRALPPEQGVALGVFDARRAEAEDAAEVLARLAPHRETLMTRDVLVGPHAGFQGITRDEAFEHLLQARYLAESLVREWRWPA
jgi:5-methyltetrahydropteroyltriglutamate--homocysteine methyltransferase